VVLRGRRFRPDELELQRFRNNMLSVAIVTFNCQRTIAGTLDSLIANIPSGFHSRLIIVDNHSGDGTLDTLRKYAHAHEFIHLICNNANVGFGRAHNQVLSAVESRYHAICNPDIIFSYDIFTPLMEFIQNRPQIGLSCPKFLNPDGTLQPLNRRHPSVLDLFIRRFLSAALEPVFQKRLSSYDMRDVGYDHSYDVPFVSGAFMFCRTAVLKAVGGFDERFFLYFEDADLSRKVQALGYRTVYCPDVTVTHAWERLAHKSWLGTWIFAKSAYKYFRKWGFKLW
jgi:GT2 family glycosyltransferase